MASIDEQPTEAARSVPDPSWRGFYKIGGIAAVLYIVLGLIVPTAIIFTMNYNFELEGAEFLSYISQNQVVWLILQTLVLGTSILAIVAFVAMFLALKHLNRSYALLGAVIAITVQILFVAYYPVILGLSYLSDRFVEVQASQREVYVTASEALVAMNGAFNPLYESLFAAGIFVFSLVMLRGVFRRWIAYLGFVTTASAFVALALWPVLGIGYFWWWVFFAVWFTAVGWELYRMGRESDLPGSTPASPETQPAR